MVKKVGTCFDSLQGVSNVNGIQPKMKWVKNSLLLLLHVYKLKLCIKYIDIKEQQR